MKEAGTLRFAMLRYNSQTISQGRPQYLSLRARWTRALREAFRICCWALLWIGFASITYITLWRGNDLSTFWWIPYDTANWADDHHRLGNLAVYGFLAALVMVVYRNQRRQLICLGLVGAWRAALEYGQLFIPDRSFAWQNIALCLAGLMAAWILMKGVVFLSHLKSEFTRQVQQV
jgi:hypothetical protein